MRTFSAVLLLCCAAVAQERPPDSSDSKTTTDFSDPLHPKTTIVVTASRTEEDLKTTPVATTLVTRKEMDIQPAQTVDQNLNYTPGLSIQRSKGPADSIAKAQLRGFSGANRTLVLLDGQPINDSYSGTVNWSALPIDEVQSVEIVRGPFSSLYGGAALGGVINILTRPVEHREIDLRGEYGSNDSVGYSARYSDRFFNRLGLSLGYQRLQYGGYPSTAATATATTGTGPLVTGVVPTMTAQGATTYLLGWSGANWSNQHTYRVRGEYAVNDSTIVTLQYILMRYNYGYDVYQSSLRDASGATVDNGKFTFNDNGVIRALSVTPSKFMAAGPGGQYNHFWSTTLQHKFSSNQILRIDAGYYNTPAYNYRTPGSAATVFGGAGTHSFTVRRNLHGNAQYSFNARHHSFVAGTETHHDTATNSTFSMSDWTQPDNAIKQTYLAGGRSVNQSVYAQDSIQLAERLRLVAGGRYDYWQTYNGKYNTYASSTSLVNLDDRSSNSLTGKVALTYKMPGDWVVRASAGTAFRSPTIYDLYATSVIVGITYQGNPALKPEHVKSWETGVRKQFGQRTNIDVAYYENYITDMIYRVSDLTADPNGSIRVNVNAGEGRTRGVEASLQERVFSWLQFRGNYTYTDAIITKNPAAPASVDKRALYIPEHMASAELLGAHKKWTGSLGVRYSGATFNTDTNVDSTKGVFGAYDPYFLMEGSLGYQISPHVQVYGTAGNLLDRRYFLYYLAPGRTANIGIRLHL